VIAIQHRPPKNNKTKGKVEKNSNKLSDLRRKKKRKHFTGMFESVVVVIF